MLELDKESINKHTTKAKTKKIKNTDSIIDDNVNEEINISEMTEKKEEEEKSEDIFTKIKKFYISHSSKPTYAETAKRFNLNTSMVADIAREEDWFTQREYYWAKKQSDQLESLEKSNENIFKSLSAVVQIALKEHATAAIENEKRRKAGKISNTEVTYNLREVMAMVKTLKEMSEILRDQVDENNKSLKEMTDSELLSRVSEDEAYNLDLSWVFGKEDNEETIEDIILSSKESEY
jgi:hypothetical protein